MSASNSGSANPSSSSSSSSLYTSPRRYIYTDADLDQFLNSPAKAGLMQLVRVMGKSCSSSSSSSGAGGFVYDPIHPLLGLSPSVATLHGALQAMVEHWIARDIPPLQSSSSSSASTHFRFGNPAFKTFYQRLTERSIAIVHSILQQQRQQQPDEEDYDEETLQNASERGRQAAGMTLALQNISQDDDGDDKEDEEKNKKYRETVQELACYLNDAFGHPIRLDYGTGHECSFQVFLYCLCKIHCFGSKPDQPPAPKRIKAITISIYHQYLKVTRRIQTDYMLEPAGSHGVWGLDDYHCLPFYFGACQLEAEVKSGRQDYSPASIHDESLLRLEGDRFLYFDCIRFIKSLKKGAPFFESAPMLNDISHLPSWGKVASGLILLFEGEVLKKRQVVQHFKFGSIFAADWTPSQTTDSRQAPTTGTFRTRAASTTTSTTTTTTANINRNMPPSSLLDDVLSPTKAPWAE
jgi:hypothetical protein